MRITMNVEMQDSRDSDGVVRLLESLGATLNQLTGATVTMDRTDQVSLIHDTAGSGHVWAVVIGDVVAWTYASIEGPMPDALELWNALAAHLPMYEPEGA